MSVPDREHLILLVEDDLNVVKLFTVYLSQAGYDVVAANTGEDALEAALMLQPAAIILDLLLPTMDGWEVLAELKSSSLTQHIPVLIVSVLDRQQLGFRLGAVEHLVKPVDRRHLLRALERTILRGRYADRPPRVLLVHDDDDELEMLAAALEQEGYQVVPAYGSVEGIRLAHTAAPDLAVLDLLLSDIDSFQVIASLRSDDATARIPILVLMHRGLSAVQKRQLSEKIRTIVIQGDTPPQVLLQTVGHILLETRR
jgi:DNA-binding response OmpR family regulator